MGFSLVASLLCAKKGVPLDWQRGYEAIDSNMDVITKRYFAYMGDEIVVEDLPDDLEENTHTNTLVENAQRKQAYSEVHDALIEVKKSISGPYRNVTWFTFGPFVLWFLGERTWGDAPDGFDSWILMANVAPEVMRKVGFIHDFLSVCDTCAGERYYTPCEHCGTTWGGISTEETPIL